jgi:hypothetical protein
MMTGIRKTSMASSVAHRPRGSVKSLALFA